uniref:Peptidase M11 gametolysin domain-containing protein n=1 Tax=Corethron hystrix TaxID=216773 RepID=A0A7S1B5D5_9STRA
MSTPAGTLSDEWFGTLGKDRVNMKSQFKACSYGKLTFDAVPDRPSVGLKDGVMTVRLNKDVRGNEPYTVQNWVRAELFRRLGSSYLKYDHLAFCMPPGMGLWLAYGYVPGTLTVYNDEWCGRVSAQMHEVGHNLGFDHSGTVRGEYDDTSGMMGYSWRNSDTRMCFNAPKSWSLGWYNDRHAVIDPLKTGWTGNIVGITDYRRSNGWRVLLKIVGADKDIFVSFNRVSSFNMDTKMGRNQVLITKVQAGRDGRSISNQVRQLSINQSFTENGFRGRRLVIKVLSINVKASPPLAKVCISVKSDCSSARPQATPKPTQSPTPAPTTPKPSAFYLNFCSSPLSLSVMGGTHGKNSKGIMFDLFTKDETSVGKAGILVTGFVLRVFQKHKVKGRVWTKSGTHVGYEARKGMWDRNGHFVIQGSANDETQTLLLDSPLYLPPSTVHAIYFEQLGGHRIVPRDLETRGGTGDADISTEHIGIHVGTALRGSILMRDMGFRGKVNYHVCDSLPSSIPSYIPSKVPSVAPSESLVPTANPSTLPTVMPSRSHSPTQFVNPSRNPTNLPTLKQTKIPTNLPTLKPTKIPTKKPIAVPCTNERLFRFVDNGGTRRRSCWGLPLSYCNKWDENGRLMKNHCRNRCGFCNSKWNCADATSFYYHNIQKPWNKCSNLAVSRCNLIDNKGRLVKEFCRKKCSFCG